MRALYLSPFIGICMPLRCSCLRYDQSPAYARTWDFFSRARLSILIRMVHVSINRKCKAYQVRDHPTHASTRAISYEKGRSPQIHFSAMTGPGKQLGICYRRFHMVGENIRRSTDCAKFPEKWWPNRSDVCLVSSNSKKVNAVMK